MLQLSPLARFGRGGASKTYSWGMAGLTPIAFRKEIESGELTMSDGWEC